jgi:hypothetical protein
VIVSVRSSFGATNVTDAVLFPIRVLLQLVRAGAVFAVILSVVPFFVIALTSGGNLAAAAHSVAWFTSAAFACGCLLMTVFVTFRYVVAPRFPSVSPVVTFAVAAPLGAALLAGVWNVELFLRDTGPHTLAALANWIGLHSDDVVARFFWSCLVTIASGAFGAVIFAFNRGGVLNFGPEKFIGGLMVGRAEYEAFAQRESVRLRREYDDYVNELRSSER